MTSARLTGTEVLGAETRAPRALFVPVDGSPASHPALDLAIRLARQSPSEIVLVDLLDSAIEVHAPRAAELGEDVPGFACEGMPIDEEGRTVQRLRQILFPLQGEVEAAGIEASIRLLHGDDPANALRALVSAAGPDRALVLSHPLNLSGEMRRLTGDLLIQQPCTVYLTGATGSPRSTWRAIATGLLRWSWQRLTR
jgi:nucleotide-binding universal stress UspA family protein